MALDPEFKAKWVAALRSGEFKQGVGALFDGKDAYCCLGVACLIAGVPLPEKGIDRCTARYMPLAIAVEGLDFDTQADLGDRNDATSCYRPGAPQTFEQIADFIEASL